jgi:hypothetical protein
VMKALKVMLARGRDGAVAAVVTMFQDTLLLFELPSLSAPSRPTLCHSTSNSTELAQSVVPSTAAACPLRPSEEAAATSVAAFTRDLPHRKVVLSPRVSINAIAIAAAAQAYAALASSPSVAESAAAATNARFKLALARERTARLEDALLAPEVPQPAVRRQWPKTRHP